MTMERNRFQSLSEDLTRNERRILGLIFRRRAMTQLAIAEETDLTQQSVSRIVAGFSDKGLLESGERISAGKRGYPSTSVMICPRYAYSAGVCIGADAVSFALVDFSGTVCYEQRLPLTSLPIERVLNWTHKALDEAFAQLSLAEDSLLGMGVAISGSFITDGGFNTPLCLEEWAGVDVARVFTDRFGVPAFADNDGNAAAMAESLLGAGRWANSFAYLYIATGVGGGLILDGELWRGRFGNAGEFAGGLPSSIYPFPNLELLRQLVAKDGMVFDSVDALVQGFDPGWPAINDWIARVRDSLSIIASNATSILDLDAIVLGGKLPKALAERIIPHIEFFDIRRRAISRPMAKIVAAETSGDPAAIGAALLPLKTGYFG
ncbi:ROK family transcriptional regulator [Asticcacaulis sp. 201]|uniref:ROK family transcriptional regulator n=1 Tax=Asticcacaulis sp. 201 TaxID=3028787 RepID=UPI002915E2F6|nr:ROK family transcriptional regulator [Asticcacaulis sp. 201]MDV6330059.1 ROK family transcriptional regulator [Asticcacaulis sp. 201]